MNIWTCPANNNFSILLSDVSAFVFFMCEFQQHAHVLLFIQAYIYTSVCAQYVKTTFTFGVGAADSTRIICTLAHLGWTRGTHHHSTESPPSFLTGLETKKGEREREKVSGRVCSFMFCSWQRLYHNLVEIIEVLKLLSLSPSVSLPRCLCQFQTRCQFKEAQGVDAR